MLLLIWCGALCSFTDPSLWLLHSRSPPAPPPQMIVSTRALLSVRLYVPQSVHAGWPLPTTSFCSVWLPCPPFLLSNASSFTCHVFLSFSRCLSLLFFVHLLSFPWPPQWSVCPRWLQHGAFPNWLGQGPFPIPTPTKLPIWCPPHIWLPTPSFTHSPGSDTLLLPVRCPWRVYYLGDVNRFQVVHPPRLCHLFETSPLWVVACVWSSPPEPLFLVSARHYSVNLSWYLVFSCCCTKISLIERWGLILMSVLENF